jgi:hypothetical protein
MVNDPTPVQGFLMAAVREIRESAAGGGHSIRTKEFMT